MTASNYMPDVVVEIAFDSGFGTPAVDRTWTDVSEYVELQAGLPIGFGRADEMAQADANTLTLTLDNRNGRFTPELASGANYPNVKLGRPIRVKATRVGGSAKTRFLGYIADWTPLPGGSTKKITVTATSNLARLGLQTEVAGAATADQFVGAEGLYILNDASSPAVDSKARLPNLTANTFAGVVAGSPAFAGGIGPDGAGTANRLTDAAVGYNYPNVAGAARYPTGLLVNDECVVEFFFVTSSTNARINVEIRGNSVHPTFGAADQTLLLSCNFAAGDADLDVIRPASGGGSCSVSGLSLNDGKVHHLAARLTSTDLRLYIDGALVDLTLTTGCVPFSDLLHIEIASEVGTVDVSYVAISNDGSTIPQRAIAGIAGERQTASARIEQFAAAAGVETTDVDATTDLLDDFDAFGKTFLAGMRAAETTDGGVLFDAADGTLTYHDRESRYGSTSAFTLSVASQQIEASAAPKLDRSGMVNEATVTRTGTEESARASDFDSIDAYGIARAAFEIQQDATACLMAAAWQVFLHAEPETRIPNLEVDLLALSGALQDSLLAATVGTRFTVTGLPADFPASSLDFFVEGYAETIGVETYRIAFNVSKRDPAKWNVWTLEDATYGAYDSNPLAW